MATDDPLSLRTAAAHPFHSPSPPLHTSTKAVCASGLLPDVLSFPRGTDLHDHALVTRGLLVLQDLASCVPAHVMAGTGTPAQGRCFQVVLDAFAAPGNKASQLAAVAVSGSGMVVAVEREQTREKLLRKTLQRLRSSQTKVVSGDFLRLDPDRAPLSLAQGILVDPSCSGSGTLADPRPASPNRLQRLAAFQSQALLRALTAYERAEVVVYSTCSVHKEENEDVVAGALRECGGGWELEHSLPAWHRRGIAGSFPGAERCLRFDKEDLTQGFFVACFTRKKMDKGD